MTEHFTLDEFNISGGIVPKIVQLRIKYFHAEPMEKVRAEMNDNAVYEIKIWPSLKSGYRPVRWEKSKGRNGTSQHTFRAIPGQTECGAVDWTCTDFRYKKHEFLGLILKHTKYTRIAIYNGMFHCDYKPTPSGRREIYTSNAASKWKFLRYGD